MMDVFGPVPDPDVAVDDPEEGEQPSRAPSLMQQHDAYLSGMLRPAFQQLDADPAYMLAAFELVANAVCWLRCAFVYVTVCGCMHFFIYARAYIYADMYLGICAHQ